MNEMISLFIDDELKLGEKILFVNEVRDNPPFASDTIEMLQMEKRIRADVVDQIPRAVPAGPDFLKRISNFFAQPLGWVSTALAAVLIAGLVFILSMPPPAPILKNRFVVYLPQVHQVEITGSFTNWRRIPMHRAGDSGYWEVNLALPAGEYAFAYIVDGRRQITDPTIRTRERDDFGGYNSILYVDGKA